jgi:hypothetical protein
MSFLTKDTVVFVYILFYLFYKKKNILQNFELRPKRRPILLKVIKRGYAELGINSRSP